MVTHGNTVWVFRRYKSGIFDIQAIEAAVCINLEMQIGIDEGVAERLLEKKEIHNAEINTALQWLKDEFILEDVTGRRRVFAAYYDQDREADFQILGRRWCAGITRPSNAVPRLTKLKRLTSQQMVPCLLEGNIEFIDESKAVQLLDPVTQFALDRALNENYGGYIELWKEYGRIEWQKALKDVRSLNVLHYKEVEPAGDEFIEWRFFPKSDDDFVTFRDNWRSLELEEDIELEVAREAPAWIHAQGYNVDPQELKGSRNSIHGKVRFDGKTIVLRVDDRFKQNKPEMKGVLYASLAGHITVQQRRERAKQIISRGARLPQLRFILEGISLPAVAGAFTRRRFKDMTPYAKKIFSGSPTEKQKEAIYSALNTPDISIIVGPPGTGKTQVIAAIQRRLAEEFKDQPLQHQVLISSFQHDAVENALARTEVFGLPPYKVGLRTRRLEDKGVDPVEIWCKQKYVLISEKLRDFEVIEPHVSLLKQLNQEIAILRIAHFSSTERSERIQRVTSLIDSLAKNSLRIPMQLREEWDLYYENIEKNCINTEIYDSSIIRLIRGIRVTEKGFADDGPDRAWRCLRALERANNPIYLDKLTVLKQAATSADGIDCSTLSNLSSLKDFLLDSIIPDYRPPSIKSLIEPDLAILLNKISSSFDEHIRTSRKGVYGVLTNYCDALLHEPDRVSQAAREYCSIVGATCQQSASEKMVSLKRLSSEDDVDRLEFDTVIIDEAARANPLDLFIPMSMARRRIILVGDHLQLPHLLDPEIESELGKKLDLQDAQKKAMEQSLFERLVLKLREMESVDKFPRVVMLDTQYRMHPILGEFISKNFYEKVGESRLHPGRTADNFALSIPGFEGKVCAWLNVSTDEGSAQSFAGSLRRKCEAERVAKELKKLMLASPNLSFGVITFYSAQRDQLMREMRSQDIAKDTSDGIKIHADFASFEDGTERLRIGTVDSFQGKEFDVVILSLVRSFRPSKKIHSTEEYWNSHYGFLRLPNRMNVAMSRQRSLLIIIGDINMAEGEDAKMAVPALHEYLNLCRGPYGVIR